MKIKFRPSTVKGRPGTIIYLVTCRRIVRQIATKYKVFPEEWDARQSRVMPVDAERVDAVRQIVRKMERDMKLMRSAIVELRCSGRRFTSDDVVGMF
ncbi:MAG: site-specific integrase, partial [Bacteroidaceae bacterium]|nr:site-specific integrase [Bacteroidaceae bacterium]